MRNKIIMHLRGATEYILRDRGGVIGCWVKYSDGWLPVVLRQDLWRAYL